MDLFNWHMITRKYRRTEYVNMNLIKADCVLYKDDVKVSRKGKD